MLLLAAAVLSLAPYMSSSAELVRLRNAILIGTDLAPGFDWEPPEAPSSYLSEAGPKDPFFTELVSRLGIDKIDGDWGKAVAISTQLLKGESLKGGALKSDLRSTYSNIVTQGGGYCADFVRVFTAMALSVELPVRYWAFSFDGFGGHGHVLPEIWNRQLKRWQAVDVFNNYYFVDGDDEPLSALQLQQALTAKSSTLQLRPLYAGARLGYDDDAKALAYYQRGVSEWYLWWGNNVFSQDRAFIARALANVSRSLEQLGGIVQGVQPTIRVLPNDKNLPQRQAMHNLKLRLGATALIGALAIVGLGVAWRLRRRSTPATARP